jgi:enoyl-CoA hydratase/carnithine racemase
MSLVLVEDRGPVRWLTINRPNERNAMNDEVLLALIDGMTGAEAAGARVMVLTGAGEKAFCAGGDLKKGPDDDESPFHFDVSQADNPLGAFFRIVSRNRVPIIARVNGHALGGGAGLVGAADLVVAADHAKIGTPEAKIGVYPMVILSVLMRNVPQRVLNEMALTGEPLSAQQALDCGLINYVVPSSDLDAKVEELAGRILKNSPTAVKLGKQAFHALRDMTVDQAIDYTQLMIGRMAQSEDAKEGFQAFREKRAPNWPGR